MFRTLWNALLVIPAMLGAALVISSGVIWSFVPSFAIAQSTPRKDAIATEPLEATKEGNARLADSLAVSTKLVLTTDSEAKPEEPAVTDPEALKTLTINESRPTAKDLEAPEAILSERSSFITTPLTTGVAQPRKRDVVNSQGHPLTGSPSHPLTGSPPPLLANGSPTLAPMPSEPSVLEQIENYTNETPTDDTINQITNVTQLRDVSPTDWAFEALRSLVERYGCIAGYPDSTYRGNQTLSRYEFAAGLNACLQQVERLIGTRGEGLATKEDLATIQRLTEEFGPELAALRGKVDALEARTNGLEATQFSTTTKLNGEVIFGLTGILSGDDIFGDPVDNVTILGSRIRLNLDTSFSGRDLLRTRLQAVGLDNLTSKTQTYEGSLAFAAEDENANNNVEIDALLYKFPIGRSTEVVIVANGGEADDFASTVNFLDGDGGSGALTRFGTRNPIYYLVEGSGIGIRQQLGRNLELSLGYLAGENRNTANPVRGGLFNGPYGAMAQLVYKPSSRFQIGLTYINSYNRETLTGSPFSNPRTFLRNLANQRASINFQPAASSGTPITFPANQPISAGVTLPEGTTLPAGTTLVESTALPFDVEIPRPRGSGTITIRAGTRIPAGTTLPQAVTLPIDVTLPAAISLPIDLTIPGATTPPPDPIVFDGTIGELLSQPEFAGIPLGFDLNIPIVSHSYGIELSWQLSNNFVLGGWVGYTTTKTLSTGNGLFSGNNINTINGAVTLAFPDLGGRGNLGGIILGVEPHVIDTDLSVNQDFLNPSSSNPALVPVAVALANSTPIAQVVKLVDNPNPDVSLHIEAFYQYRVTDNIFITPGLIVITSPGGNTNNSNLVIGTIRTTFTF